MGSLVVSVFALSIVLGDSCVNVKSKDSEKKAEASVKIIAAIFDVPPNILFASNVLKCNDFLAVVVQRKDDPDVPYVDRIIVQPVIWRENPTRVEVNLGS